MKKLTGGFTLIELLIVIALLGALAVGLLAALDPFEQLKKGTDTGTRNTVSELQGAIIRYYAIKNEMPWGKTNIGPSEVLAGYSPLNIGGVISTGELKSDFSAIADGQLSNITIIGTSEGTTVCFKPLSRSFRSDLNTKYDSSSFSEFSAPATSCGDPGTTAFHCEWCVK